MDVVLFFLALDVCILCLLFQGYYVKMCIVLCQFIIIKSSNTIGMHKTHTGQMHFKNPGISSQQGYLFCRLSIPRVMHECPVTKLCWYSTYKRFVHMCSIILYLMNNSRIFPIIKVKLLGQ